MTASDAGRGPAAEVHGRGDGWSATEAGRAVHTEVETHTDELSAALYARADAVDPAALADDLERLAAPVLAAGIYPSPNPMGLPTGPVGGAGSLR